MNDRTKIFEAKMNRAEELRRVILEVHSLLKEKGYNPVAQIAGYILTGDPTYITAHGNARIEMSKLDRDEILEAMVRWYLSDADKR